MTPYEISILLHIYASPSDPPQKGTALYDKTIKQFTGEDLIYEDDDFILNTTEKGDAHVKQLCDLPLPVQQYVRFDGVLINTDY